MTTVQEKLREVFLLDQQVRGLRSRLDELEGRHQREEVKRARLAQQHTELDQQLKQAQVTAATSEKQVKEVEQRVDQLRGQMNNVRSNKEYSAMLIEVNTAKVDLGKLEEEALGHMSRVDMLREELGTVEQQLQEQTARVATAKGEVDQCAKEIGQELGELISRKDQAEREVPDQARTEYSRVSQIHGGETMAEVVETNRRTLEYSCGGCYMSLPVERVNALISNGDSIVSCPSCSRLLYVDQELRASVGGK